MVCQLEIQDGHHNRTNLIYDPIGKIFKNYSYFKFKTQNHLTVNMDECSLDDPLQNINMCFFVKVENPRWQPPQDAYNMGK